MKNKKIFIILIIVILILLVMPVPLKLKDGGSIKYVSLFYSVTKIHRLNHQSSTGYEDGWKIEILGIQVYNEVDVYAETIEKQEEQNIEDTKESKKDNSEEIQFQDTPQTENTQALPSIPTNNQNQTVVNTNSTTANNKPSINTNANNNKQPTTIPQNNNQQTNTPTIDNNQPVNDNNINKELEETTKKWFITQYNIARQQYINSLNNSISSKNTEITTLRNQAKTLYSDYVKEVDKIKRDCIENGLGGSGYEKRKLQTAEENYKQQASAYTNSIKQLEGEVAEIQAEISNPNVDNILSIVTKNCNISSRETYEYYYKYL